MQCHFQLFIPGFYVGDKFITTHFFYAVTGELGWELFVKRDGMLPLYEAITEAGKDFGMVKFGKFALDTLRQEKGMRGWGREVR